MSKAPRRKGKRSALSDLTLPARARELIAKLDYWETNFGELPTRKIKNFKDSGEARAKIDALREELAGMNVFVSSTAQGLTVDAKRRKDLIEAIKRDGPRCMDRDEVKKKSCCEMESFEADDPGYSDKNGESHKKIKFKFKVKKKSDPKKCVLVNWVKGSAKNGDGTFFTAKHQDKDTPINFPDWTVDTVDTDPVYWSEPNSRWNYTSEGGDTYSATDDPGPALSSEKGAVYALKFRMCIYCLDDVPEKKVDGTITAKALKCIDWQYSVKVANNGTFTHPNL